MSGIFIKRRALAAVLLGSFVALTAPTPSRAQYPEQAIKIVVPFGAGGFVDGMARIFTDRLAAILGKPVVIDNRPGAGGKLGEDFVAAATPDGYTLFIGFATRPTLAAAIAPDVKETDMLKAFTVVGALGTSPILFTSAPTLGVKDFPALLAKLKAEPNKHSYGSPGPGTESHLISAQIVKMFNLDVVHVPYRGGAAALTDVAAGQVAWMVNTPVGTLQLVETGKVNALFVINQTRLKQLPNVPTTQELGYDRLKDQVTSIFLMAPAGTPKPVLDRLNAALNQAHKDPAVISALDKLALIAPPPDTSLDAARGMAVAQIDAWAGAVKAVGKF